MSNTHLYMTNTYDHIADRNHVPDFQNFTKSRLYYCDHCVITDLSVALFACC